MICCDCVHGSHYFYFPSSNTGLTRGFAASGAQQQVDHLVAHCIIVAAVCVCSCVGWLNGLNRHRMHVQDTYGRSQPSILVQRYCQPDLPSQRKMGASILMFSQLPRTRNLRHR
jgi:hypothetical protein